MSLNSTWMSLAPLLVFNVILLSTVLVFRRVYRLRGATDEVEARHSSKLLNKWMREYWLWLTNPIVQFFIRHHVKPNTITFLGTGLSAVAGYFFWRGNIGWGGWFMIFAASFDIFDGRVARLTHNETKSGAYFDSIMDRISESLVFLGIVLYYSHDWSLWIVYAALIGSIMVSYTKAKGDEAGANYNGGSMQRPERIVYLGVGAAFAPLFTVLLSYLIPNITVTQLYLVPLSFVALMTWVTSIDRMKNVMKMLG